MVHMVQVEMYVTRVCPYCIRAKALLKDKGVSWEEHDISTNPALQQEMVNRANGRTTVPQIFINDQHVGGCDDLFALEAEGKLEELLAKKH